MVTRDPKRVGGRTGPSPRNGQQFKPTRVSRKPRQVGHRGACRVRPSKHTVRVVSMNARRVEAMVGVVLAQFHRDPARSGGASDSTATNPHPRPRRRGCARGPRPAARSQRLAQRQTPDQPQTLRTCRTWSPNDRRRGMVGRVAARYQPIKGAPATRPALPGCRATHPKGASRRWDNLTCLIASHARRGVWLAGRSGDDP